MNRPPKLLKYIILDNTKEMLADLTKENSALKKRIKLLQQGNRNSVKALQDMREATRLIPISEKLPEAYKDVIILDMFGKVHDAFITDNKRWMINEGQFLQTVTHWREKLVLPDEEDEDE